MFTRHMIRRPRRYPSAHALSCKWDVHKPCRSAGIQSVLRCPPLSKEGPLVSRHSLVSIVTRLRADRCGVRIPVAARYLFSKTPRPVLRPTQPVVQSVLGALSVEAKRPGTETDGLPPEVKNEWSYASTPLMVCVGTALISLRLRNSVIESFPSYKG